MDEVEQHRRRRTRGRVAPAGTAEPARSAAESQPNRATAVTPADIADRAGGERGAPDHHPAAADRPLPLDVHAGHPGHDDREGERGLRGLVGGGSTQVSVAAAMRARDAARPTDAEVAEAESTLTIVHRGWVPRDPT